MSGRGGGRANNWHKHIHTSPPTATQIIHKWTNTKKTRSDSKTNPRSNAAKPTKQWDCNNGTVNNATQTKTTLSLLTLEARPGTFPPTATQSFINEPTQTKLTRFHKQIPAATQQNRQKQQRDYQQRDCHVSKHKNKRVLEKQNHALKPSSKQKPTVLH